tara:strand:+ start:243 stop:563 length:321 start_codon:yes stop_codon:yes gene_type:complete
MTKYHKTEGGLWLNSEKTKPNHPDKTGNLEISREQLKGLIAMGKKGEKVKIKLASWDRKSKETGQHYQYVTGEVFYDLEEATAPPPPPPPEPALQPILMDEDDIPF